MTMLPSLCLVEQPESLVRNIRFHMDEYLGSLPRQGIDGGNRCF